jgi:hypothetical protein
MIYTCSMEIGGRGAKAKAVEIVAALRTRRGRLCPVEAFTHSIKFRFVFRPRW